MVFSCSQDVVTDNQGGICRQNQWGEDDRGAEASAAGARIEAPRGVGCGEGVSPFPPGEGAKPPLQNFFLILALKMVSFGAFWVF